MASEYERRGAGEIKPRRWKENEEDAGERGTALRLLFFLLQGDSLLSGGQHLVEGVDADCGFDAVDPFVLLLRRWSRDAINHVVTLDHSAVRFCFTGFYELPAVVGDVQLKAIRLPWVLHFPNAEVFQRNDPPGFFVCCVLKVIKAVVC